MCCVAGRACVGSVGIRRSIEASCSSHRSSSPIHRRPAATPRHRVQQRGERGRTHTDRRHTLTGPSWAGLGWAAAPPILTCTWRCATKSTDWLGIESVRGAADLTRRRLLLQTGSFDGTNELKRQASDDARAWMLGCKACQSTAQPTEQKPHFDRGSPGVECLARTPSAGVSASRFVRGSVELIGRWWVC